MRLAKAGRGSGLGREYKPWITIHDVSSHGRSHRIKGATTGRVHHLLSDIERGVFLESDWDARVVDIREQFPLNREDTLAIAKRLGVRHPRFRGVDVVMTTDLLLDVLENRQLSQLAVAVKPWVKLGDARVLEKLEIERLYWASRNVRWCIQTERQLSRARTLNLLWLHEARWLDHLQVDYAGYWQECCATVMEALQSPRSGTVKGLCDQLEAANGWKAGTALFAIRHLAANRLVHFDLNELFNARGPVEAIRPVALS